MTPEALRARASAEGLSAPLAALWWDARGDWDKAHEAAQSDSNAASCWVHAYLHRKEGDLANADYWYRRARQTRPSVPLESEWHALVVALGNS